MSTIAPVQEGRAWIFAESNLNTDLMMPNKGYALTLPERSKLIFATYRPGWADQVRQGDIIVAGRNFGAGSSRPVAEILRVLGISAIVAESIAGIFFRNCVNYALPVMECPGVLDAVREGDIVRVDIAQGVLTNTRTGESVAGAKMPPMLLDIIKAGGTYDQLIRDGYL
ncbi:MAG TPA: 3-isopropylmalate dehydratase [Burkholderiales bacterium]|nr:3-isopropylmalate dehydratase [Burkholderiales bacterium]